MIIDLIYLHLLTKFTPIMEKFISTWAKVSEFITSTKSGIYIGLIIYYRIILLIKLTQYLFRLLIDIEDKLTWKSTPHKEYYVKTATCNSVRPHHKAL